MQKGDENEKGDRFIKSPPLPASRKKGDRFIFPALLLGILRENKSVLAPPACASSIRQ
jgi:hypothetical protein